MSHELYIDRTNYQATVKLNGVRSAWEWTVPPITPPDAVEARMHEETGHLLFKREGHEDWFAVPTLVRDMSPTQLLAMLTHDEARELLGYCQHVTDQLGTHIGFLLEAMGEALAEKRWQVMRTLNEEIAETLGAQALAGDTASLAYEALS